MKQWILLVSVIKSKIQFLNNIHMTKIGDNSMVSYGKLPKDKINSLFTVPVACCRCSRPSLCDPERL